MAWEHGNLKTDTNTYYNITLFLSVNIGKKLLVSRQISDDIKQFSYEICQRHSVIIRYMETDKDHIHYMIETEPTMSISKIINLMRELYNIPYMEKISPIFTKTILERT
ncbi:MAG: transposase [Anaerobutyricum sp.]